MITRIAGMGCRIALDDFGTGADSLAYLKGLQVSRVKIDGSFVSDIVTNRPSRAAVRGIVELARGFKIDTVAEFVENREIAGVVRKLGVDYAQGYAFGKPEPLEGLLRTLGQGNRGACTSCFWKCSGSAIGAYLWAQIRDLKNGNQVVDAR